MPPDEYRSEGTPSLSEGPDARGETFWFLLCRLTKGTRRKGETISRRYRNNGYVPNQPRTWSAQRPPSQQQNQAKLLLTTSNTSLDNCPEARIRSSSPFINA